MLTIGFNMSANLLAQVPLLSIDFTFVIEKSQIGGCIRLTATDSLQIKSDNQL
jgi:hypothetical protein